MILEPLTKFEPPTVSEKLPTGRKVGVNVCTTGTGFWRVTELVAESDVWATLVALIFTEFGDGRLNGVLYFPVASMVPKVEFPPPTPFTDQVTAWFMFAVTVAEN
jgi:hypothetical protein